jgi:23S rRNA (uracil1939-C5)-methyltransferase
MLSSGQCTTLASPGTFFQVNPHQNKTLVAKVLSILRERGVRRMVDLFCGNGNFSIPASLEGIRVTGVEFFPGAVADAKTAMEDGEIVFFNSDVESFLTANPDMSADAVLVDPPRAGLSSLVRDALLGWAPETIVYVSCDPATLARDLRSFLESGYNLTSVKGFDMFPNSAHIEALAVLERK